MPIYFEEDNFIEKSKPYNIDFPYFDTLKKLEKQSGLPYQIVNICGNNYIRIGNDIITLK